MDKLFAIQRFSSWLWGLGCNSNKYLWSTAKQQNVGNRKQMHGSVSVQGMISVYALLRNVSCEELQWVQHFGFGDRNGTNALEKHLPVLVPSLPSAQMVCGGGFFFFEWIFGSFFLIYNELFQGSQVKHYEVRKILETANIIYTSNICIGRRYKSLMYVPQKLLISFYVYFVSRCYMGAICSSDWCGNYLF